jgi:hypothetical protein
MFRSKIRLSVVNVRFPAQSVVLKEHSEQLEGIHFLAAQLRDSFAPALVFL